MIHSLRNGRDCTTSPPERCGISFSSLRNAPAAERANAATCSKSQSCWRSRKGATRARRTPLPNSECVAAYTAGDTPVPRGRIDVFWKHVGFASIAATTVPIDARLPLASRTISERVAACTVDRPVFVPIVALVPPSLSAIQPHFLPRYSHAPIPRIRLFFGIPNAREAFLLALS